MSLASAMMKGTLWSLALRWLTKAIGLVSTIILARLLVPEDFGVVAMASLCVGFVEMCFAFSSDAALLRETDPTRQLIDSAWTLKVVQGLAVGACLALVAPFAATFFAEPRITPVLWLLSLGIVVSGFGSYGPLLARKNLNFALEVKIAVGSKIISFIITVGLAVWLRSYWALAVGTLAGYVLGSVFSYTHHSYRSRFCVQEIKSIWTFSQWMLFSGIGQFFGRKTDEFLVGRLGNAANLGLYSMASDLGQMVSFEIGAPINRALLPVLSQIKDSAERMRDVLAQTISACNLLILPAGFGLAAVSDLVVGVFLGEAWTAAGPMLRLLSISWAFRQMIGPYSVLLLVEGRSRAFGILTWCEAGLLLVFALPLMGYGVDGLVWARAASSFAIMALWMMIGRSLGVTLSMFGRSSWRPLVGSVGMFFLVSSIPNEPFGPPALALAVKVLIGGCCYIGWTLLTWKMTGRPEGLESRALGAAAVAWTRFRGRLRGDNS